VPCEGNIEQEHAVVGTHFCPSNKEGSDVSASDATAADSCGTPG
jgi:hypothetical protein